jgi:hypothetical protein
MTERRELQVHRSGMRPTGPPKRIFRPEAEIRAEVAEEIAQALETEALSDYDAADDLRWAAAKAREIGAGGEG